MHNAEPEASEIFLQNGKLAGEGSKYMEELDITLLFGRDAYAPMLTVASHNERYLKAIKKRYRFEKNII